MTLRMYYEQIKDLIEKNPELSDWPVVYAADDEGNRFEYVIYAPSIGYYDVNERSFRTKEEEDEKYFTEEDVICIN